VNDLLTIGAEPLLFLDYFATGRLDVRQGAALVRGIARGCKLAGCSLVGGETAELPSFYPRGEYDLAGFAVGVVERGAVVDGRRIRPGDALIGLASAGLHSNGYALARHVLLERARLALQSVPEELGVALGEELLRPTRIYVRPVRDLLARLPGAVHGMAHVTGGGLPGNVPRVLPRGCRAVVRRGSWTTPPIFSLIQRLGRVPQSEMDRTFNNGIGFVLAVAPTAVERAVRFLRARRLRPAVIGEIVRGKPGLDLV
jgi:phosphoribosylformylglycinamidine cyclo-ligase